MPYSTSWIQRVDEADLLKAPTETFRAGPIEWNMALYRSAPELQAFRDTFGPECGGQSGLQAARCVTDLLKARSPSGAPRVEFVDAEFDPAGMLHEHMGGAPGHCTARSAMTATSLLALGVPARIVQVLPQNTRGHNLVEVWDVTHGWLLFDPHFDSPYLLGDSFLSAVQLSQIQGGLRWRRPAEGQPDPNLFAGSTVHYPEPWLYTRVGERCARWPFRGCFAQVGPIQFRYGWGQRLALGSVGVFGLGALFWAFRALGRLRRHSPQPLPQPVSS